MYNSSSKPIFKIIKPNYHCLSSVKLFNLKNKLLQKFCQILCSFNRRISRIALKFSVFEYSVHELDEYLYTPRLL